MRTYIKTDVRFGVMTDNVFVFVFLNIIFVLLEGTEDTRLKSPGNSVHL